MVTPFPCDNCWALGDTVSRECPPPADPAAGYLYAVEIGMGITKVGVSRDPAKRFRSLEGIARRNDGSLVGCAVVAPACGNYRSLERQVHLGLMAHRVRGEYFRIGLRSVREIFLALDFEEPVAAGDVMAGPVDFRGLPKSKVKVMIPEEVAERVGILAVRGRRPANEVVTELLCIGLGIDPSAYGIESSRVTPGRHQQPYAS